MNRAAALVATLSLLALTAQQSAAQNPAQGQRITRAPDANDVVGLRDGASGPADWRVKLSPTSTMASWSTELAEYDPVNQADDLGWAGNPATLQRWTGRVFYGLPWSFNGRAMDRLHRSLLQNATDKRLAVAVGARGKLFRYPDRVTIRAA